MVVIVAQRIDFRLFLQKIVSEREPHSTAKESDLDDSFMEASQVAKVYPLKLSFFSSSCARHKGDDMGVLYLYRQSYISYTYAAFAHSSAVHDNRLIWPE